MHSIRVLSSCIMLCESFDDIYSLRDAFFMLGDLLRGTFFEVLHCRSDCIDYILCVS